MFRGHPPTVFEACRDVTAWPTFMPAVRSATFLEQGIDADVVRITAEVNDDVWTWTSRRRLDPETGTIQFQRVSPPHPILRMAGSWRVSCECGLTIVELTHSFEVVDGCDDVARRLEQAIVANARRDLAALQAKHGLR
jgi:aromatase